MERRSGAPPASLHASGVVSSNSSAANVFKGLTSHAAAVRLSKAVRAVLADDAKRIEAESKLEARDTVKRQLLAAHHLVMLTCAVALLAGYGYGAATGRLSTFGGQSSLVVSAVFIILGVGLNIALVLTRSHRLRWEVHGRVSDALLEFERATALYDPTTRALLRDKAGEREGQQDEGFQVVTSDGIVVACSGLWAALEYHDPSSKGSTHAVPVYRDGEWARLPRGLLVKGDLIALMAGETAPAKVRPVDGGATGRRSSVAGVYGMGLAGAPGLALGASAGGVLAGLGGKAQLHAHHHHAHQYHEGHQHHQHQHHHRNTALAGSAQASHLAAASAATSAGVVPVPGRVPPQLRERDVDVLTLCGDLRRYTLLDTPAAATLRRQLRAPHRPQPLLFGDLRSFTTLAGYWQAGLAVLALVAVAVRTGVSNTLPTARVAGGDGDGTPGSVNTRYGGGGFVGLLEGLLLQVPTLVLCLSPITLPLLLGIAELYGTAHLLATHEAVRLRARLKKWRSGLLLDKLHAVQQQKHAAEASAAASAQASVSSVAGEGPYRPRRGSGGYAAMSSEGERGGDDQGFLTAGSVPRRISSLPGWAHSRVSSAVSSVKAMLRRGGQSNRGLELRSSSADGAAGGQVDGGGDLEAGGTGIELRPVPRALDGLSRAQADEIAAQFISEGDAQPRGVAQGGGEAVGGASLGEALEKFDQLEAQRQREAGADAASAAERGDGEQLARPRFTRQVSLASIGSSLLGSIRRLVVASPKADGRHHHTQQQHHGSGERDGARRHTARAHAGAGDGGGGPLDSDISSSARGLFSFAARRHAAAQHAAQTKAALLASVRTRRPDVGDIDDRGEYVPLQYAALASGCAREGGYEDSQPRSSGLSSAGSLDSARGPFISTEGDEQPAASADAGRSHARSEAAASTAVSASGRSTWWFPRWCCSREPPPVDASAVVPLGVASLTRVFDGPALADFAHPGWRDIPLRRIAFYLRRLVLDHPTRITLVVEHGGVKPRLASSRDDAAASAAASLSAADAVSRLRNRLLRDDLMDVGFGLPPVRSPLLTAQLLLRLGSQSEFVCADRGTVTEPQPVVENVMILKGANSSAIVDLHADDASPTGVRFDDKNWRRH